MKNSRELQKMLDDADIQQVGQFMKMFDRILLYTLAVNTIPKEDLQGTLDLWERVIKKTIDVESKGRTEFLESTIMGRKAKYAKEPDGEEFRLHSLRQFDVAKSVILANLHQKFTDIDDVEEVD